MLELLVYFQEEAIILNHLAVAEVDHKKNLSRVTIVTTGSPRSNRANSITIKKISTSA